LEVIKRIWRSAAEATGRFLDEAGFRVALAWDVLVGKVPRETQKRFWNRRQEAPVLVDVRDWTTERRIFSVLVWPPLESAEDDAAYHHMQRVEEVKGVLAKGATAMAWQTLFEVDYGLEWDSEREVWITSDGFAYDGKRVEGGRGTGYAKL